MINFIEVGSYHPTNTNYNYNIFIVIDENRKEGVGLRMFRSDCGGEYRAIKMLQKRGKKAKKLYAPYQAIYKWLEVKKMRNIEEIEEALKENP